MLQFKQCGGIIGFIPILYWIVGYSRYNINIKSVFAVAVSNEKEDPTNLRRRLSVLNDDPKTVEFRKYDNNDSTTINDISTNTVKNPRKFVSYTSSEWERQWIENVDRWTEEKSICNVLLGPQSNYVHDFLNATCTYRYDEEGDSDWCIMDDAYRPLYYNTANRNEFQFQWSEPSHLVRKENDRRELQRQQEPFRITSDMEHIFSKFVFLDETTGEQYVEYIEPLVSHLRFVLAGCPTKNTILPEEAFHEYSFRGWVVPPPSLHGGGKRVYFDAGASEWSAGQGGPSLSYFNAIWGRHSIEFDDIYAYEMKTPVEQFYDTVPDPYKQLVHYQQCAVSSAPADNSEEHPFLPKVIQQMYGNPEDYVLFKLDIDSPEVENGNIMYILDNANDQNAPAIDELVYEHHVGGNYIMSRFWGHNDDATLRASYELFLQLRLKGIRAHSWV